MHCQTESSFGLRAAINRAAQIGSGGGNRILSTSQLSTMLGESESTGHDASSSTTRTSTYLLEGLRDRANAAVWQEFIDRYRPMIVRYGIRLGLNSADAEDVAQQTLVSFCTSYQQGKYDRNKGRLRHWLFGIARNQIANWSRRKRSREVQIPDASDQTGFFAGIGDDDAIERVWEQEWRDTLMQQCLAEIRREVEPHTFEAFDLFAAKGLPAEQVAEKLGMSANAVFSAKRRILRRVRELLPKLDEIW
jgi:RNA polymerase sigma-70 factor (ECF subfamily)